MLLDEVLRDTVLLFRLGAFALETVLLLREGALLTRLPDEVLLETVLLLLAGALVTDLFCELLEGFRYVFVLRVTVLLLGVWVTVLFET